MQLGHCYCISYRSIDDCLLYTVLSMVNFNGAFIGLENKGCLHAGKIPAAANQPNFKPGIAGAGSLEPLGIPIKDCTLAKQLKDLKLDAEASGIIAGTTNSCLGDANCSLQAVHEKLCMGLFCG